MKKQQLSKESKSKIIELHLYDRRLCKISSVLGIKRPTIQYTPKKYN